MSMDMMPRCERCESLNDIDTRQEKGQTANVQRFTTRKHAHTTYSQVRFKG